MPDITSSPDKEQTTLSVTITEGPNTDEVDITAISSDDSSDYIILDNINGMEEAAGPDEEPVVHTRGVPPEVQKTDEEPKVKRARFSTPEPSPPSEPTPPPPPPLTPSTLTTTDDGNLLTQRKIFYHLIFATV